MSIDTPLLVIYECVNGEGKGKVILGTPTTEVTVDEKDKGNVRTGI